MYVGLPFYVMRCLMVFNSFVSTIHHTNIKTIVRVRIQEIYEGLVLVHFIHIHIRLQACNT
jgi:hypothetical protein